MSEVSIIGAGLAGLLAGNMLRHKATIYEKQKQLPNNHAALLRFRSTIVGNVLGIPFKKVNMIKSVYDSNNPVTDTLKYSKKVLGTYRNDRSLPVGVVQEERYIAPPDLIEQMAKGLDIEYNDNNAFRSWPDNRPLISTIPMPALMHLLRYNKYNPELFKYKSTWVITADLEGIDAYVTLYYPSVVFQAYRASITGNKLIIELPDHNLDECSVEAMASSASSVVLYYLKTFGVDVVVSNVKVKAQQYGKIIPIDEDVRKDFMHWATDEYNIYSLGRFATWRPGLLLDDLVHDVSLISQWIRGGGKYGLRKHRG